MEEAQILQHLGKLGCVVRHQNCASHAGYPLSRSPEVCAEDVGFANPLIVKEAIGALALVQSWHAREMLSQVASRRSYNSQPNTFVINPRSITVGMGINQWQL
jgi:hypothetical protein